MQILAASAFVLVTSPLILAGVAPIRLEKRACNADNCLRALEAKPLDASTYCTAYTTSVRTVTTGFPTYIPQSCGPSRVSSACSCLATATASPTPTPCPTSNVVANPDFYGVHPGDQTLTPWVITSKLGSPGCTYVQGYSYGCQTCGSAQDPDAIGCEFPASGGSGILSQDLTLCAGHQYNLLAHAACWRNGPGDANATEYGTQFTVMFNDQVIVPKQPACPPCVGSDQSCLYNYPRYFNITGMIIGSATGKGTLKFVVEAASSSGSSVGALLDAIFLTPQ